MQNNQSNVYQSHLLLRIIFLKFCQTTTRDFESCYDGNSFVIEQKSKRLLTALTSDFCRRQPRSPMWPWASRTSGSRKWMVGTRWPVSFVVYSRSFNWSHIFKYKWFFHIVVCSCRLHCVAASEQKGCGFTSNTGPFYCGVGSRNIVMCRLIANLYAGVNGCLSRV